MKPHQPWLPGPQRRCPPGPCAGRMRLGRAVISGIKAGDGSAPAGPGGPGSSRPAGCRATSPSLRSTRSARRPGTGRPARRRGRALRRRYVLPDHVERACPAARCWRVYCTTALSCPAAWSGRDRSRVGGHHPVPAGGAPERRPGRPPAAHQRWDPRPLWPAVAASAHRHGQVLAADRHRVPAPQRVKPAPATHPAAPPAPWHRRTRRTR